MAGNMENHAKLVAVCPPGDSEYHYERRQIPLEIEDQVTMVMEFPEDDNDTIGCDHTKNRRIAHTHADMDKFFTKYTQLSKDELAGRMMVTKQELFSALNQFIPCVGCRNSVERLFSKLAERGHQKALEPLVVTPASILSINRDSLSDPRRMYILFFIQGPDLRSRMASIQVNKKNRRCALHTMDNAKTRLLGIWIDVWEVLSKDCRDELIVVEADALYKVIESYLRKHRFCQECKNKVVRAYQILVGEVDHSKEKGYCLALYEGLRCCGEEKHVHVLCDTDFIAQLIVRAEPDINGGRRERHAKTMDVAQEEVLTCLGIYLYERFCHIWTKLRAEEQTWHMLFYVGIVALKKCFDVAIDEKRGMTELELVCNELTEGEQARQQQREKKRQKKKDKKKRRDAAEGDEAAALNGGGGGGPGLCNGLGQPQTHSHPSPAPATKESAPSQAKLLLANGHCNHQAETEEDGDGTRRVRCGGSGVFEQHQPPLENGCGERVGKKGGGVTGRGGASACQHLDQDKAATNLGSREHQHCHANKENSCADCQQDSAPVQVTERGRRRGKGQQQPGRRGDGRLPEGGGGGGGGGRRSSEQPQPQPPENPSKDTAAGGPGHGHCEGGCSHAQEGDRAICGCSDEKQLRQLMGWTTTLEDMLESNQSDWSPAEPPVISSEEIRQFRANEKLLQNKRQEQREKFKQRFNRLLHRKEETAAPAPTPSVNGSDRQPSPRVAMATAGKGSTSRR